MGFTLYGPIANKIRDLSNYIYCISLFVLIMYSERIVYYISVILISIRVLYNIDLSIFVEHYVLDGSLLLMEGEDSGRQGFNEPGFSNNQGHQPSEASTGNNMQLDNTSSNQPDVYLKDNGDETSSKNLSDWGIRKNHNFNSNYYTFRNNCYQMASLLEYQHAVYGHKYVDLHYHGNENLLSEHHALEFFENFAKKHNIDCEPQTKVSNNVGLRNLFREQGDLHQSKK